LCTSQISLVADRRTTQLATSGGGSRIGKHRPFITNCITATRIEDLEESRGFQKGEKREDQKQRDFKGERTKEKLEGWNEHKKKGGIIIMGTSLGGRLRKCGKRAKN